VKSVIKTHLHPIYRLPILILAWLISTIPASQTGLSQQITPRGAALDDYLKRLVPAGFSGSVLVADSTGVVLHDGYGWADINAKRTADVTTIFSIGSLTKQFTAAGILLLGSQGRLTIQDTLGWYFPDAPADKKPITIHQLLSHTSGLRFGVIPSTADLTREEVTRRILFAAIIEIASGKAYRQYLQSSLFVPLGMRSTGFRQDPIYDSNRVARAYNEWKDLGSWASWSKGWLHGSGDIVSTTGDLHTWFNTLKPSSLRPPVSARKLFSPHAEISESRAYGYGFYIETASNGDEVVSHGGDTQGYHSELRWYMDSNLLVIILTNFEAYDESGVGLGLHKRVVASNLRRLIHGEEVPLPPASSENAVPPEVRGRYLLPDGSFFHIHDLGPFTTIGAKGQTALNLLMQPTDSTHERCSMLNLRSERIISALSEEDSLRLASSVSEDERFFLSFWPDEWDQFTEEFGAYVSHSVYGTYPLPWDYQMSRTYVLLTFERKSMDYQFTWSGSTLYETVWDMGKPYPLMYSLIPTSESEFATFDRVTEGETRFRWVPAAAATPAKLLFPGGVSAGKEAP
jgi:CubicO group peptidase (beta-lactamase class C family)